jgi:hypothetical protein
MFRHRIASCLVAVSLGVFSLVQNVSAETVGCSLTGYTFMGGANAYTSTEASHSKTYFLSQPLNMDFNGANYYGYGWAKCDDVGAATVGSAVLHLNLLGVGAMPPLTPASPEHLTILELYNPGATDVASLGGSDEASWTLRDTLRDTLDASSPFGAVTITANGDVAIDITNIHNSWVSGAAVNNAIVFCSSDDGNGGQFSSFGSTAGAPYVATTAVPEPGAIILAGIALIGLGIARVLRRRPATGEIVQYPTRITYSTAHVE